MRAFNFTDLFVVWMSATMLGSVGAAAADGPAAQERNRIVLTNAAAVRSLKPAEAAQQFPVRLRATVTFVFDRHSCFVQDQSAGIFVGNGAEFPELSPGDVVVVEGVSGPGEYAPTIAPALVQIIGRTSFPPPRQAFYDDLLTGREDSQWVEVSGLVRAVYPEPLGGQSLEITTGGGRISVFVPATSPTPLERLVDSKVRVQGVCGTWFNRKRQLFDIRLLSPGAEHIVVEEPAAANALAQPSQSIGDLLLFAPEASYGRRVKVDGTVVLQQPGRAIFVQDDQHGLYVQTRQTGILQPGDRVQLFGFPVKGDYTPMLQDAVWERVGAGPVPLPVPVTSDEALGGLHDSRLVQIEGFLLNRSQNERETVLLIEKDKHIFAAYLEGQTPAAKLAELQNQSRLRLTGVCRIEVGEDWRAGSAWRAKSFRILMRTQDDVEVLKLPTWWTFTRLLRAMSILTAAVLVSLTWAGVLRRRVSQQTAIIRRQLDLEAKLKERYQDLFEKANDIVYTHDLSGRITSINMAGVGLLGRDRADITKGCLLDFIAPEQRSAAVQWLEHIRDGTAPETLEWDFITATGERARLEICTRLIDYEGRHVEVEGIARDVTERRRLENEILEISTREQRRIGHDLHDGICQQLTGIGFLSAILADKLREQNRPEAAEASSISELVNKANKQTHGAARGLFPIRLEENGLVSALQELAENTGGFLSTHCGFQCSGSIVIRDHAAAHHIYYIAQEAIVNAAKHGKAQHIDVVLAGSDQAGCVLTIRDNGVGLAGAAVQSRGMGIRIMKYRARMIGADLELKPGPGGGTEVVCRFGGRTTAREDELTSP